MSERHKIAPTIEAIDEWRARGHGVDIWTKASACRCIVGRYARSGIVSYETIVGTGSSNGSRRYKIPVSEIVRAEAWS